MSWESNFDRVLNKIVNRKDSDVFRSPVDWKELAILDYPLIIKKPMDLQTIRERLNAKYYGSYEEAASDMRLIWSNAMLFNASGSRIYQVAKALSEYFESLWMVYYPEDPGRLPSNEEISNWVDQCHRINPDDLGKILSMIDEKFSNCMTKKQDTNEVEIHVDLMPGALFREVQKWTQDKLPEDFFPTRRKATVLPSQHTSSSSSAESNHASKSGGSGGSSSQSSSSTSNKQKGGVVDSKKKRDIHESQSAKASAASSTSSYSQPIKKRTSNY